MSVNQGSSGGVHQQPQVMIPPTSTPPYPYPSQFSSAWRDSVKSAADFNKSLMFDRRSRGSFYFDPHTQTIQILDSWGVLNFNTPTEEQKNREKMEYLNYATQQKKKDYSKSLYSIQKPISSPSLKFATPNTSSNSNANSEPKEKLKSKDICSTCYQKVAPVKGTDYVESELLTCTECNVSYHPRACLKMATETLIRIKELSNQNKLENKTETETEKKVDEIDWRCSDCKVCDRCSSSGNEDKLLFCDLCDRGFHTFCLAIPLPRPPPGRWLCDLCVKCISCGSKTPGPQSHHKWHKGYRYCEPCNKLRNKGRYCSICQKSHYGNIEKLDLYQCTKCQLFIHPQCEVASGREHITDDTNYVCFVCHKKQQANLAKNIDPKNPSSSSSSSSSSSRSKRVGRPRKRQSSPSLEDELPNKLLAPLE